MREISINYVEPIGRAVSETFHGPIEHDVFPKSERGEKLRALRRESGLGPRTAAARLGLAATDLSAIEAGRATCDDWEGLFDAARSAWDYSYP